MTDIPKEGTIIYMGLTNFDHLNKCDFKIV